jgi:YgiT-type zinc finger domain-containing protein
MSQCYFCKGEARPGLKDLLLQWGDEPIRIVGVPAEICQECGHAWFGPEETDEISRIIQERVGKTGEITVPVYEYEAARQAA